MDYDQRRPTILAELRDAHPRDNRKYLILFQEETEHEALQRLYCHLSSTGTRLVRFDDFWKLSYEPEWVAA